jgi:tripartite-type tricarboxylate transporter receptor subunit TctC
MLELGYPGFVSETFLSLHAPAGTPQPVVDRMARESTAVMGDEQTRARMRNAGFIVRPDGPAALGARVAREVASWRDLITRARIAQE